MFAPRCHSAILRTQVALVTAIRPSEFAFARSPGAIGARLFPSPPGAARRLHTSDRPGDWAAGGRRARARLPFGCSVVTAAILFAFACAACFGSGYFVGRLRGDADARRDAEARAGATARFKARSAG